MATGYWKKSSQKNKKKFFNQSQDSSLSSIFNLTTKGRTFEELDEEEATERQIVLGYRKFSIIENLTIFWVIKLSIILAKIH
jgi:hypothetical protein